LSIAAITVGRSPLGADAVLSSRYRPYSEIAVLITLIAILGRLEQRMRDWLLALSFALVGIWFWTSWQTNLPGIADLALRQRNSLDHYAVNGHGIYGEFPPQYFGDLVLNDVRQGGYFEPVKQSMPPRDLIKDVQPLHSTQGSRLVIGPLSFDTEAISVHGLLEGNQENVTLWLVDGATQYRAPLRTERMFKSLADNDLTLFWNTLRLHGVAPGRYRIGYAAGHDAAAVVWADAWADIQ